MAHRPTPVQDSKYVFHRACLEVLVPAERPCPEPQAGEVLIKVRGAGVNRPDIMQRQGKYPPPPGASDIPGLEIAGTVEAIGEGVDAWSAGDRVCGGLSPGPERRAGAGSETVRRMSDEQAVLTDRRDRVLLITINRPDQRNAVNAAVAQGISDALDELDGDADLSLGVLTGAGKGFSAGMDLKAFVAGERPYAGDRGFAGIVQRPVARPQPHTAVPRMRQIVVD